MNNIQDDDILKNLVSQCITRHKKAQRIFLNVDTKTLYFIEDSEIPVDCKLIKERYEYVTLCNPSQWFARAIKNAL